MANRSAYNEALVAFKLNPSDKAAAKLLRISIKTWFATPEDYRDSYVSDDVNCVADWLDRAKP